jgi:hypothetical protein
LQILLSKVFKTHLHANELKKSTNLDSNGDYEEAKKSWHSSLRRSCTINLKESRVPDLVLICQNFSVILLKSVGKLNTNLGAAKIGSILYHYEN